MNLSLFRETVSQHSLRLKEENTAEFKLDSAINEASYYNQVVLGNVEDRISLFKEKLVRSNNMPDKLFKEGLADVGKAIWGAIVKVLHQIVRVAVNVRMWVNGGEKSLFKRIDKVINHINSKEELTGTIALPILNGDTGMKGYYNAISVMANLLSGKAYENCSLNGNIIEWREVGSSSSLLGVISSNTRAVASAAKGAKLDATDVKAMQSDLMKINKSASKGINKQLLKSVGDADTLKGIYKVTRLNHITKTSATQALNALKTYIKKAFDKSEFEKTLSVMLKETKACLKGSKGGLTIELQGMAKVSLQTLNIMLNDYLNMVKDIKLALLDIMQSVEKGGSGSRQYIPKTDKDYGITKAFTDAVSGGEVKRVRIMLKDSMLVDPTFKQFNEMIDKASEMDGLFDAYDKRRLSENESDWTKDYMNKMLVSLSMNFCYERIDHLEQIIAYLYKDERMDKTPAKTSNEIISVPYFVESCDKQDAFAVKSTLVDMITRVKGDKKQLDEAIKYAESNGAFEWDKYDEHESSTVWGSVNDEYNFEKERLVQNFCKKRYERVLKLYKQTYGGK